MEIAKEQTIIWIPAWKLHGYQETEMLLQPVVFFVTCLPWETFFVRSSSSKFPKRYFYQCKPLKSHKQNPPAHLHSRQSLGETHCF